MPAVKHRDCVWLDSDLEAAVKSLLRRCHALLKLIAAPLKTHRGSKGRPQVSKTQVQEFYDLSLQLAQVVGCKPIMINTATSAEPTDTEDFSSSAAEPRFCLLPEPQGYAQHRPTLPILELLEQQLDTNWQLRRRLHVANNRIAGIAQEICSNNQRLEVAGRRIHVEAGKDTLVHDGPPPTASRERLLTTPVRSSHRMTRRSEISRLKEQISAGHQQPTPSKDSTHQLKPAVAEALESHGEATHMHFDPEQKAELSGTTAPHEKEASLSKTKLTNGGGSSSPPAVESAAPSPPPSAPSPSSATPVGEGGSASRQQPKQKQKSLLRKVAAVFKPSSSEGTE
ncbi:unnamed protein product [Dibothriocephalus latus]|uniref:Uncharacterized protein n=1 Tax=Dibothriocephalus latus TaxID=60516 RepID=A0A3P7LDG8_DIBLA|nr:unnamed protein product [Dibothriocephalus latus]